MKYEELTNEELIKLYRDTGNEDVKEYFFKKNIKFPYHVVYKFSKTKQIREEFEDIISEANKGLVKAFNTFDMTKNIKFSTYAGKVISNEILQYLRALRKRNRIALISMEEPIREGIKRIDDKPYSLKEILKVDNVQLDKYVEVMDSLNRFFRVATSKEKTVYDLIFNKHMTQDEIGKAVRLSQAQVSRIANKVKGKLINCQI